MAVTVRWPAVRRRWSLALALLAAAVLTGCTATAGEQDRAARARPAAADVRCAEAGGGSWQEVTLPAPPDAPAGGQVVVTDLLSGGEEGVWAAVGAIRDPDGGEVPAAWHSTDGERWRADRMVPVSPDGARQRLIEVARTGSTSVAVGMYFSRTEARPRPSAWRDGGDGVWREVPAHRELFGGPRAVGLEDIAAGEPGFLIAGPWRGADDAAIAGVWRSPDGAAWTRPSEGTPLTGGSEEVVHPAGVSVGEAGVALVGSTMPTVNALARMEDGAAWFSADGERWTRVDGGGAFGGRGTQKLTAVTATPSGFAAVGVEEQDGTLRPAAWTSPDGRAWAQSPQPAFAGVTDTDGDATLTSVTTARGGCLLAAGVVGTTPRLWASRDGRAWAPVALPATLPADPEQVTVAAGQNRLLVTFTGQDSSEVWLRVKG